CEWVGLDDRVRLHHEDATAMSFAPESFDRAYMLHVGMNIPDKRALAADVYRVLRPGAILGIYDVMRVGPGELEYPVPWASAAAGSALATAHEYRQAAEAAGFRVLEERDRRAFALEFFARMRERIEAAGGPPPLGLHVILGARAPEKLRNMVAGIASGAIAPVELLLQKVGG
ncbi:MAG: class I SAM-dependent methyltransferase, partial [Myxococcales bacterium]|nr:class I SAM-dependent methyltransferase [Myxococcales bacterium]